MGRLPAQDRRVVALRFGIGDPDQADRTLAEIADRIGCSRQNVSNIEARAVERLRPRLEPRWRFDQLARQLRARRRAGGAKAWS